MLRHHYGCCRACCDLPAVKAMQETQGPEEGKIIYPRKLLKSVEDSFTDDGITPGRARSSL